MKTSRFLVLVAFLPLACGQGAQSADGSASAPAADGSTSAPAPKPRVSFVVPAGTLLPIAFETTVSSDTSHEGDAVLAVLTENVPLAGFTLDSGSEVRGRVVTAVPAKRVSGHARLVIAFDSVTDNGKSLPISTERIDTTGQSTGSKDKKIIGGGALGGLIVGAL